MKTKKPKRKPVSFEQEQAMSRAIQFGGGIKILEKCKECRCPFTWEDIWTGSEGHAEIWDDGFWCVCDTNLDDI